jgi:hypothetical protein
MGMPKGETAPFVWQVWFEGDRQPTRFVAFDEQHIRDQSEPRVPVVIERIHEREEKIESEPLGPKGSTVNRPADYDAGFKILRAWVDENGGPPEEIRVKLRELYIDYDRAPQKTTRYSARRKKKHKI